MKVDLRTVLTSVGGKRLEWCKRALAYAEITESQYELVDRSSPMESERCDIVLADGLDYDTLFRARNAILPVTDFFDDWDVFSADRDLDPWWIDPKGYDISVGMLFNTAFLLCWRVRAMQPGTDYFILSRFSDQVRQVQHCSTNLRSREWFERYLGLLNNDPAEMCGFLQALEKDLIENLGQTIREHGGMAEAHIIAHFMKDY